jgi:hypothetical protein
MTTDGHDPKPHTRSTLQIIDSALTGWCEPGTGMCDIPEPLENASVSRDRSPLDSHEQTLDRTARA